MQIKTNKIIAVMIVLVMLYASFGTVVSYAADAIIDATKMEQQNTKTNVEDVSFDAYYEGGKHSKDIDIQGSEKLYVKVNVTNGVLKNPVIRLSNTNLKITAIEPEMEINGNSIKLDQVIGNREIVLTVTPDIKDTVSSDFFDKQNTIEITGTYVNQNNNETSVRGDIKVNAYISAMTEESVSAIGLTEDDSITKLIPYSTSKETGVIVEGTVKTRKTNILPAKSEKVSIQVPEIDGKYPTSVKVLAKTPFVDGSFVEKTLGTYDAETGIVNLEVNNDEDSISWLKNVENEYKVICKYPASAYEAVNGKSVTLEFGAKTEVLFHTHLRQDNTVNKMRAGLANRETGEIAVQESTVRAKGNLVDVKATVNGPINKGYMYNNVNAADEDDKETPYSSRYEVFVAGAIEDKIEVKLNDDRFMAGDDSYEAKSIIKSLKIDKENIKNILGDEGTVTILSGSTILKTIDKDTEETEISLADNNVKAITLRLSAPVKEGTLAFDVQRAIGKDSKNNIESFDSLKTSTEGTIKIDDESIAIRDIDEGIVALSEPEAKATITIKNTADNNSSNISTVITNRVAIEAILETDSIDDRLYNNPTIEITLPEEYLNNLNVVSYELTYGEQLGLSIESVVQNGNKIVAKLNGVQTKYGNSEVVGPRLQIIADITPDAVAPTKEETVTMEIKNVLTTTTKFNYVAEPGLVTINNVTIGSEEKSAIRDNTEMTVAVNKEDTAVVKGRIINNLANNAQDVKVLIKLPVENEDSGFEAILKNAVQANDATVYYSSNVDATDDINKEENGWNTEAEDLGAVKAILIVENNELQKGNEVSFIYNIQIPDMQYNKEATIGYKVSYNDRTETETHTFSKKAPDIKLTTGQGPELRVLVGTRTETVRQGQLVNVNAAIVNDGTEDVNNIKVTLDVPEKTTLMKYNVGNAIYEDVNETTVDVDDPDYVDVGPVNDFIIENLKPGEQKEVQFILKINEDAEEGRTIDLNVTAKGDEITGKGVDYLTVEKGYLTIVNRRFVGEYYQEIKEGDAREFVIDILNNTDNEIKNLSFEYTPSIDGKILQAGIVQEDQDDLPDEIGDGFTVEGSTLKYTGGKLTANGLLRIKVLVKPDIATINSIAKVNGKANGEEIGEHYSNNLEVRVVAPRFDAKVISADNQEIKEENQAVFEYEIKNTTDAEVRYNQIFLELDRSLQFQKADITFVNKGQTETITAISEDNLLYNFLKLDGNEKINIKVYTKAGTLTDEEISEGEKEVKAKLEYVYNNYKMITLNSTYYIVYNEDIHGTPYIDPTFDPTDDEQQDIERITHKISGTAWYDENKNGQRDNGEMIFPDIKVILLNAEDATIVKDKDSNEEKIATTDNKGEYTFNNLTNGKYLVAFLYDDDDYIVTTYQKEGVPVATNSDAIGKNILYEGIEYKGALTDTIVIFNKNQRNIDLGLYKADKFGLSIAKKINKVTLTTPDGTKVYDYSDDNKQISKVEIKDKYLNSTTVVVEYKISVTNNGNVAGYAKKIVDYLPKEMKFNSELNPNWYIGTDGNAYSIELANTEIKPGETKEVTIVLTKTMTSENTGVFANSAEIAETYNTSGLDNDENNKTDKDNNTANIAVTTKTGQPAMYITLSIFVISIMGFGAYEINKHVINAEERG